MNKGYIYIMTNPCLQDMVKIGFSNNVEERRKQLSTTALPYDYEIFATYETPGNLEDKKLHQMIDQLNPDLRVSKNKEFFIMTPEEAYSLLETIAKISGTDDKLKRYVDTGLPPQIVKHQPVDFEKCGIPKGSILKYTDDPSVTVIVVDNRKILYKNEITSMSSVAGQLKGVKHIQGSQFFTYNGRTIVEIAQETQWKNN